MKIYARIDNGAVAEIFSTDKKIEKLFHPSIQWIDVSSLDAQPLPGWVYDGNEFSEPEPVNVF